jgi:hypothetical protein
LSYLRSTGHIYARIAWTAIGRTTGYTYEAITPLVETINLPAGSNTQTGRYLENTIVAGHGISFHFHMTVTYSLVFDTTLPGGATFTPYFGNIFLGCH